MVVEDLHWIDAASEEVLAFLADSVPASRVLMVMTHRPGYRHPLSDNTVEGIRNCLSLITAREIELNEAAGRPMDQRPRFVDEPQTSVVVPLNIPGKPENEDNKK